MTQAQAVNVNATRNKGPDLFVPLPARIVGMRSLTPSEKLLMLVMDDGKPLGQQPGQFVQVSIFGYEEAPISVSSCGRTDGAFELCVRRAGRLTTRLHAMEVGQKLGIRGPFGRGFPTGELEGKDLVFVAGGIGLAPMRSLIQHCLAHRQAYGRLIVLYGSKRPAELLFTDELAQWKQGDVDVDVRVTVDAAADGWTGTVGMIPTLIPPLQLDAANTEAIIVGPPVMYKYVIEALAAKGLADSQIIVSLERHMRCGVGKCGHCVIGDTYYCCCDGPVFRVNEVKSLRGAL